mgnify:FL=1
MPHKSGKPGYAPRPGHMPKGMPPKPMKGGYFPPKKGK